MNLDLVPVVVLLICGAYAWGYSDGSRNRGGPK